MKTRVLDDISIAADILRQGGTVAFPTETVYGLGASALSHDAIQRVFDAKGRPSDNPIIVHLDDAENWAMAASELTTSAKKLLEAFAPGPITTVLPKADRIPRIVTAGLATVGIRIPAHPTAHSLLVEAGIPIAAPSANLSGRPSCTTWQSVLHDLDGRIDAILRGDAAQIGVESSVVDCTREPPTLLRTGGVSLKQLREIEPSCRHAGRVIDGDTPPSSPGLRHPHYQPAARVQLIDSPSEISASNIGNATAYIGITPPNSGQAFMCQQIFSGVEQYAAGYYEALRNCDRQSADCIFVQRAIPAGIGQALLDRQSRSADQ